MAALPARDEVAASALRGDVCFVAGGERASPLLLRARGTLALWKITGPGPGATAPAASRAARADRHVCLRTSGMIDSPRANTA
jgi:hypothetical protein